MPDWLIQFLCSLGALIAISVAYYFASKASLSGESSSKWWIPHVVTVVAVVLICVLVPTSIGKYLFTPLTAVIMGTVFPIYQSVYAVCTPLEDDDKEWLQYWMVGGVLFMCTEWVGHAMKESSAIYWYEVTSIFFIWLYFPMTHGATLIYTNFTHPYIAPRVKPLATKMTNALTALYQTFMNAAHLWVLWIVFMFLPASFKRIVAVAIGTVYPEIESIVAASTEEVADDTYWLTYWSVYGCLFLIMEVLEVYLGRIPGFYTLIILATVYLMLPMFTGADKLFRKVLVPLAGLQEMLMLRDAIQVKKQMLHDLPPDRAVKVRKAIAKFYADDDAHTIDPMDLSEECTTEFLTSWRDLNPFSSGNSTQVVQEEVVVEETTPLV